MIKPEHIPDEVAWKLHDKLWSVGGHSVDDVRAAIAAALSAWPNAFEYRSAHANYGQCLSLPLPQENSDDQ